MALNLGDDPVGYEIRLVKVDLATLSRVGPINVEANGDAVCARHRFCEVAVNTFAKKPSEGRDDVGTAAALVGVVVVTPACVIGEEPTEHDEVFAREGGPEQLRDLL
jgi:hypothetical protein